MKNIKLIVLDVDGTMTDGKIYIDNNGVESKSFNVKDGFAIVNAMKYGIKFAIITGRSSKVVEKRAEELKIEELYQGVENKLEILEKILSKYNITYKETAYMGDDLNDISVMKRVGFSAAPADCVEAVSDIVNFKSKYRGGEGAIREFIEYIFDEKKIYEKYYKL